MSVSIQTPTLALVLLLAACSTYPSDGSAGADAAILPAVTGDGGSTQTISGAQVNPSTASLQLGETEAAFAWAIDDDDNLVPSDPAQWSSDDASVASVDAEGNILAVRAGTATITATIEGQTATLSVTVADGDLSACCNAAGDDASFCDVAASTSACPMTLPGGYCDPDGDGSYDAMTDTTYGTTHKTAVCEEACVDVGCGCGNPGPVEVCEWVDDTSSCIDVNTSTNCAGGSSACAQDVTAPNCNVGLTYSVPGNGCQCNYRREYEQVRVCSTECQ